MASSVVQGCTGILLAGGRATRMGGVPKGLLRVEGEPIAARSVTLFLRLFGGALVIANDPTPYADLGVPVLPDLLPGRGAPGGLHAALSTATTPWVFVAACDMPFLQERAITLLARRREGADAVLVRAAGRLEPLHAFWARTCLSPLERLLEVGDPSLRELALIVNSRIVEESEWRAMDPGGRSLENANTPEDVARLGLGDIAASGARSRHQL